MIFRNQFWESIVTSRFERAKICRAIPLIAISGSTSLVVHGAWLAYKSIGYNGIAPLILDFMTMVISSERHPTRLIWAILSVAQIVFGNRLKSFSWFSPPLFVYMVGLTVSHVQLVSILRHPGYPPAFLLLESPLSVSGTATSTILNLPSLPVKKQFIKWWWFPQGCLLACPIWVKYVELYTSQLWSLWQERHPFDSRRRFFGLEWPNEGICF